MWLWNLVAILLYGDKNSNSILDNLKHKLCNASVFFTFEVGKLWFLQTDASGVAVAACAGHWDSGGNERPVAYASAKLTTTQRDWSTIEREAYAVIWALKRFEDLLFQSSIILFCDHNPLRYVVDCASKSAKLTIWSLALQEYDLTCNYRKGKLNVVAERLSRVGYESYIYVILIAINMYFCSRFRALINNLLWFYLI